MARDNLDALGATLTPAQILQGQQLAQEALDRIGRARRRPAAPRRRSRPARCWTTARRVDSLLGVESAVIPVPRRD